MCLFLYESLEVDNFVKTIGLGSRITDPTLGVKFFGNLIACEIPGMHLWILLTFMTLWLSIRKNLLPSFWSSTVVKGRGLHLLVGFFCSLVILAILAVRHLSKRITTAIRSKSLWRRQENVTLTSLRS